MVPRLQVTPRRRALRFLEPARSFGDVADARHGFSGRPDELEAASGALRVRHISPAGGDPRVHLVGARGSVEPRAPARDGLMERDAMMRIPFALAQCLKAAESGAVVAGGDRGDEPPHPREHRWPRRLADAFRERLTFLGHLLSLHQAAAQVPRLGEPLPDVEGAPRKERAARLQPGDAFSQALARHPKVRQSVVVARADDGAARLVAYTMNGIIQNLKQNRAFYARYHAEKGTGIGERNGLSGLAPVDLFLRVVGVEILSNTRLRLEGVNPFPWDVTVQYKGLKVIRGQEKTEVTFPNGKSVVVTDMEPAVISL